MKTITLAVPDWPGHRAGQHVDVRLTAPDGYQTERSYSIASAPEDEYLSVTVERLDDGEVSPYLVDELRAGDELEFRGPIGGHFVRNDDFGGPLFLVGGGIRHGAPAGDASASPCDPQPGACPGTVLGALARVADLP
ncbi:FAD-binding oxidoreductase [Kribbella sp. NPDC002412]